MCFTILELNWNQRFRDKKTKLNICHHMLTSSTQLQIRSFHVVERSRTSSKCQKMRNAHCQICKFVGFLLPSSSWLLKLPSSKQRDEKQTMIFRATCSKVREKSRVQDAKFVSQSLGVAIAMA